MGMQSLILSTALFLYVFKLFFIFVNFPMNLNQYLDQYYSETRTYIYSLIVISWSQENSLTSTTLRNTRNKGLTNLKSETFNSIFYFPVSKVVYNTCSAEW